MTGHKNRQASWISTAIAVLVAGVWLSQPAHALTLDFSNVTEAELVFNPGGDFVFNSAGSGSDFVITGGSGAGAAVGLEGSINGTFNFGVPVVSGGTQTASVTGTGTLMINSPSGDLTADMSWDQIATLGTGGIINVEGVVNVSSITYAGTNPVLMGLAASGAGILTVSFQFPSPTTLESLRAGGGVTSYSGSMTRFPRDIDLDVPDPGSSLILLGLSFLGLCGFNRCRK